MTRIPLRILGALAVVVLAACEPKDTQAPETPYLDVLPEVTSLPTVTAEGTAEYGSTVAVTRNPAFSAEEAPKAVVADKLTGRFRFVLPLSAGAKNDFSFVATDAAGNASKPATASVMHEIPRPRRVEITLASAVVNADDGKLAVAVRIGHRQAEVNLEGMELKLEVKDYPLTIAPVTVKANAAGVAEGVLTGLTRAGSGTLVATAVIAGPDGTAASDARTFAVLEGLPTAASVLLSASPASGAVGPAAAITIPAGTDVTVAIEVKDAHGNVVRAAPVAVDSDVPGARIVGASVIHVETAGSWHVYARVSGTLVAAAAELTVQPAVSKTVVLTTSASRLVAGETAHLATKTVDAFGNVTADVPTLTETCAEDLANVATEAGILHADLRATTAGTCTITATVNGMTPVSLDLTVLPGPVSALALNLAASGSNTFQNRLAIIAGTDVTYALTGKDAFGNVADIPPFDVKTDATGALLAGTQLTHLTRPGHFQVYAQVIGGTLSASAALDVSPGPAVSLEFGATASLVAAGTSVQVTARAIDAYGNTTTPAPSLSENLPEDFTGLATTANVVTASILPKKAGTYALTAKASGVSDAVLPLDVRPAAPATLALTLSAGTSTGNNLTVSAGTDVGYALSVADAYGNTVPTPAATVETDAPGAVVAGTLITRLTKTGSYRVFAQLVSWPLSTQATLNVNPGPGQSIAFTSSAAQIVAGNTLTVRASVLDAFGNVTGDASTFSHDLPVNRPGTPNADPQAFSNVTTRSGVTEGTLVPKSSGSYTLTATSGALAPAKLALAVLPAAAAAFSFNLDLTNAPFQAAEVIPFNWTLVDAFANPTGTPVVVTIDAPAATVTTDGIGAGSIEGVVRAGTYHVNARAVGTAFTATKTVVIDPAPGQGFNLVVSSPLAVEGSRVVVLVQDAFGNAIPLAQVAFKIDGTPIASHPSVSLTGNQMLFTKAGTYAVQASLIADPTLNDTELVAVQGTVDTLPPTASITNIVFPAGGADVANRGWMSVQVTFQDDRSLAEGEVDAQFGDSPACTATTGRLILAGLLSSSPQVNLRAPSCAMPLDRVTLVARVVDQAGNVGFSATNATLRMATVPGLDIAATGSGYTTTVVGFGNQLQNGIVDVAVDPNSETAYVTQPGSQRVAVIFPDHTQDRLRDSTGQTINFANPYGVAASKKGHVFVANQLGSSSGTDIVSPSRATVQTRAFGYSTNPGRVGLDEEGPVPLYCAALTSSGAVACQTNPTGTTIPPATPLTGLTNPVAVDIQPGTSTTNGKLWILEQNCRVRSATITYNAAAQTVSFGGLTDVLAGTGSTCRDLAVLPSGAVVYIDSNQQRLYRLAAGSTSPTVIANGQDLWGVDYANNKIYVLDGQLQALVTLTGGAM